ncbi:hypothetical protein [Gemmobacter sp.]|uniref:hypothetical protein n=1 Tax=Gemmobacter sp. TaxID=1898957 RepID=UPI002AFF75B6|nr:hypothetical protein [Gemmobacter sp.]
MHITLSPIRSDEVLTLHRAGDMLTINGQSLDLSVISEGATLPAEAVNSPWIAGPISRIDGTLHLTLLFPHGAIPESSPARGAGGHPSCTPGALGRWAGCPAKLHPRGGLTMAITIDLNQLITAEAKAAEALALARETARARLAAHIAAARASYITILPGQDMIYQAKEAEARAWIADPAPDLEDYPLLSAEIGLTAPDAQSLAQLWLNMASLWRQAAAGLEAVRLTVGAAIEAATTVEAITAAMSGLEEAGES